jgi:hypothetical protein
MERYLVPYASNALLSGYAPNAQVQANALQPPEFQSVAERDAWYRAHPSPHDDSPNAPAYQPQNPNDPYYQRSDIKFATQATNLGEYLAHERHLLVSRAESSAFIEDVDALREDVDRLAARVSQLESREGPA